MRFVIVTGLAVLILCGHVAVAAGREPGNVPIAPERRNAAIRYAMLWAQMPDELKTLGRELPRVEEMESDWSPDEQSRVTLETSGWLLDEISTITELDLCDFELSYELGVSMTLDHMHLMVMTYRLLLADSRRLVAAGQPDLAATRLAALIGMSRHLSMDLTHVSTRVAAEAGGTASRHAIALVKGDNLSPDALDLLRSAVARFDASDPFHARAATLATVEYGIANSALDLRHAKLKRIGRHGEFVGIEHIETPTPVTTDEQREWVESEMERCRAWAGDVIAAMDDPDSPDARLREITRRSREGEYGSLAEAGLSYSVLPVWKAESEAWASLEDLAHLLDDK